MSRSLCLIPAKGCSTRLPRKNLLPLNGQPLIARAIQTALAAGVYDEICVSTEDEEIAGVARGCGASVPFMRPESLSRDPATITDVALHALEFYARKGAQFERISVVLPTAPFVEAVDLKEADRLFGEQPDGVVMSVTLTEFPPFNAFVIALGEDDAQYLEPCFPESPYKYVKSTECPQTYRSNGAILIVDAAKLMSDRSYRGLPIRPYIMPMERSLDIDTQLEYEFARYLAGPDAANATQAG